MLGRDGVAGLVCLAISVAMLAMTADLPHSSMVPIGPDFYPRIVLTVGAFLSLLLVVFDIAAHRRARRVPVPAAAAAAAAAAAPKNYTLVILTFVLFTLYVAALAPLGYRISTFLFVVAEQALLDPPKSVNRWLFIVIVGVATSWITHITFEGYLQVLLPRGTWTGW